MHSATIPIVLAVVIAANLLSSLVGIKTLIREASSHTYSMPPHSLICLPTWLTSVSQKVIADETTQSSGQSPSQTP
jgi:hypothetical protein